MKTFDEIVNQEPVYMNDWSEKFGVIADFEDVYMTLKDYNSEESPYPDKDYWLDKKAEMNKVLPKYDNVHILFASYSCANYSGDAWVLFEQDGKLYEVNGSHCSCYGLEGQWEPDKVDLAELEHRLLDGTFGEDDWSENNFKEELCKFLDVEFNKNRNKDWE